MKRRGNPTTQCTICRHEQRHRIELALVSGASRQAVARKFNVSPHAAWRHGVKHITPERRAQLVAGPLKLHELAERAAQADMALQDYLGALRGSLFEQYLQAAEVGDRNGCATLSGRVIEVLRLEAQVNGEITKATSFVTNNTLVMSSPAMVEFEEMLVQCLRPFPDAMRAVFVGIEQMRGSHVTPGQLPRQAGERPALEHNA
ncbi:MAG: hypothetical protein ACYDB9_02035 [Gammaproteobacteria bacterium]